MIKARPLKQLISHRDAPTLSIVVVLTESSPAAFEEPDLFFPKNLRASAELIFIDDRPQVDDVPDRVFADFGTYPVRYLRNAQVCGIPNSRNIGAQLAAADTLLFMDPEILGSMSWVPRSHSRFMRDSRHGLVWSKDRRASTFLVRRSLWRALDGYDLRMFAGDLNLADRDLEMRLRILGYGISNRRSSEPRVAADKVDAPTPEELLFSKRWKGWRFPRVHRPTRAALKSGSMIVYTAIAGAYDKLRQPSPNTRGKVEFIAYLDAQSRRAPQALSGWRVRSMKSSTLDPCRHAKWYKMHPHILFPNTKYSLWVDGSISFHFPFFTEELVDLFLSDADLCVFRHSRRNCLYEEARVCKALELDSPEIIDAQLDRYRSDRYPTEAGLVEASVLLRRHSPIVKEFNEAWWEEVVRGSRRDQISFNYVARKLGLRYAEFSPDLWSNNGLFFRNAHAKSDGRITE